MVARLLLVAAVAAFFAFSGLSPARPAFADEGEAVLKCSVDNVTPTTGSVINVACSLIDNLGVPVQNTDMTYFINFQNRTEASWENGRTATIKTTDAEGLTKGVVSVGSKAGTLGILVNWPGIYSSYTFVTVTPGPASNTATATTPATTSGPTSTSTTLTDTSSSSTASTYVPSMAGGIEAPAE